MSFVLAATSNSNEQKIIEEVIMKRPAALIAGILFILVAIVQLCRFLLGIKIVAGSTEIPVWASAIAALVLLILGIWILVERSKNS